MREPLLGRAPRFVRHEGKETQLERADGSISNSRLEPSEADVILSRAEMQHMSPEALAACVGNPR